MARIIVLLTFLTYCSGVSSQPTVTQPASQSASLGQTVNLPCSRSSGGSWYDFGWYQQKPGQALRFVIYGSSSRGEGIPDRFTGSTSGTTGSLTISNIQAEDEADYYCGAEEYTGGYKYIFGGGTQLTVIGQPTVPPTVNLYAPSQEQMQETNKATLVCLINGFYPPDVTVSWDADGTPITAGIETSRPTKQNDKYVASSYLTMDAAAWSNNNKYTCKVTHDGKSYPKSVCRSGC